MFRPLATRIMQGHRTSRYPRVAPTLPDRFRGAPTVDAAKCTRSCQACVAACPTGALSLSERGPVFDLGRCLFCTDCIEACPQKALGFSRDHRLSARTHAELVTHGGPLPATRALDKKMKKLFGRSLKLRQVSAGGCNACEADVNVLSTIVFDLGRFGIQVVASPRHADGLLVTGPVTENMKRALEKTYAAVPNPKIVIATGACAISGGIYAERPETHNGADSVVPVDLYIAGCPPHPFTILDGLLRLTGRLAG